VNKYFVIFFTVAYRARTNSVYTQRWLDMY